MTKTMIAAALLSLGAAAFAPAHAEGEGNGNPFPAAAVALTRTVQPRYAAATPRDVGSAQYPVTIGRPGSDLYALANADVLPAEANEAAVQTANSLPRGFEEGTVAFAQAQSMTGWMLAHGGARATYAAR